MVHQFRSRYSPRQSETEVREELFRLKMESPFGFIQYERNFKDLWTMWIRLRGGIEDEWFKMERFKMGLDMHFHLEASLKDPTTFQALLQVCQGYDRQVKMMSSMERQNDRDYKTRESRTQYEGLIKPIRWSCEL